RARLRRAGTPAGSGPDTSCDSGRRSGCLCRRGPRASEATSYERAGTLDTMPPQARYAAAVRRARTRCIARRDRSRTTSRPSAADDRYHAPIMRWLDRTYLALSRRLGCFPGGFGDASILESAFEREVRPEPEVPRIRWTRARVHGPLRITEGEFESPDETLPLETRVARVCLLTPREANARSLAVVLAAWNDETFEARRRI